MAERKLNRPAREIDSLLDKVESEGTYLTTLPILKILDGESDCWVGENYDETLRVIKALASGKKIVYNDFTPYTTDPNAGIGGNGFLDAYYELDPMGFYDSNILVFTGLNSKGQLIKATSTESSGMTKLEVISKYDLTIDVKTGCKNGVSTIYYRIREVVPNGYIQFVRKKKTTYRTPTADYKQSRYSVKDLSVHNISGVTASTLQPNVWYEFPISKDDLVSTYAKGSLNPGGVARAYDMFKFNGNTHARPIEYSNMGTAPKATTVLHAGLQYNVLEDTFVNGTSASPIFKQRGEVIPIDVRLTVVDTSVFASGFKLIFAVQ